MSSSLSSCPFYLSFNHENQVPYRKTKDSEWDSSRYSLLVISSCMQFLFITVAKFAKGTLAMLLWFCPGFCWDMILSLVFSAFLDQPLTSDQKLLSRWVEENLCHVLQLLTFVLNLYMVVHWEMCRFWRDTNNMATAWNIQVTWLSEIGFCDIIYDKRSHRRL
jgi:hypothetical protein